jgi:hypothetical protein
MQWNELRFSNGGSTLETQKRTSKVKIVCSTILLKLAAVCSTFLRSGRSVVRSASLAHKSHGARSELNSVLGLEKVDRWNPIRTSTIQSRSRPMRFLGFSKHEKRAPRQISKWSTVCSTFSRSGWSVVRSASLDKGGTSKKRPSPHLHKVPTRSNKASPRTFQTAPVLSSFQRTCLTLTNFRHLNH